MLESRAGGEPELREIASAEAVRRRVDEIVGLVDRDYPDASPALVVIAEGARRFGEALARGLEERGHSPAVTILRARRTRGTRLGEVQVDDLDERRFASRDVIVVDDIADEGRTLQVVLALVEKGCPRSLRVAVLVSKLARRATSIRLDYVGFEVDDGWVVGMGMDLDGDYRDLDFIAIAEGAD